MASFYLDGYGSSALEKSISLCETPLAPQTSTEPSNPVTEIIQLLQRRLSDERLCSYFEAEVRFDYSPTTNKFAVRMPSEIHDVFLRRVDKDVGEQLDHMATEAKDAEEKSSLKTIMIKGSMDIPLMHHGQKLGKRSPDGQFARERAKFPAVIIEMAYSRKNLTEIAEEYILCSRGRTKCVIGLDIYCGKSSVNKTARLSKWAAESFVLNGQEGVWAALRVDKQEFRHNDGAPNDSPAAGLRIGLEDFAIGDMPTSLLGKEIFISAATLAGYLDWTEDTTPGQVIWSEREEGLLLDITCGRNQAGVGLGKNAKFPLPKPISTLPSPTLQQLTARRPHGVEPSRDDSEDPTVDGMSELTELSVPDDGAEFLNFDALVNASDSNKVVRAINEVFLSLAISSIEVTNKTLRPLETVVRCHYGAIEDEQRRMTILIPLLARVGGVTRPFAGLPFVTYMSKPRGPLVRTKISPLFCS
ncbi:hypothetical protein V500_05836 [Pseudogymnoascus sp. VKM F-4518 (FW-2643)]|nr:hypothetical protein V500_05836 [Pseudogymnoascus sp. VKM F-4518 (FW-2643)]